MMEHFQFSPVVFGDNNAGRDGKERCMSWNVEELKKLC